MPTNFQQHSIIKYSLKAKKEQQEPGQQQQDSSKIIVILNRNLQAHHHHFIPTTRKKRRCNPPNSYGKNHKCKLPQKKDESATEIRDDTPPTTTFDGLITELEFSYDCLATINVIYTSLRHAYCDSKGSIGQERNDTRLCDMEKELLIAYDDLSTQINHLERNIIKMEQKLMHLKSM